MSSVLKVSGLPPDLSDEAVRSNFSVFGHVTELSRGQRSKKSTGPVVIFVSFSKRGDALEALQNTDNSVFSGCLIHVTLE